MASRTIFAADISFAVWSGAHLGVLRLLHVRPRGLSCRRSRHPPFARPQACWAIRVMPSYPPPPLGLRRPVLRQRLSAPPPGHLPDAVFAFFADRAHIPAPPLTWGTCRTLSSAAILAPPSSWAMAWASRRRCPPALLAFSLFSGTMDLVMVLILGRSGRGLAS